MFGPSCSAPAGSSRARRICRRRPPVRTAPSAGTWIPPKLSSRSTASEPMTSTLSQPSSVRAGRHAPRDRLLQLNDLLDAVHRLESARRLHSRRRRAMRTSLRGPRSSRRSPHGRRHRDPHANAGHARFRFRPRATEQCRSPAASRAACSRRTRVPRTRPCYGSGGPSPPGIRPRASSAMRRRERLHPGSGTGARRAAATTGAG